MAGDWRKDLDEQLRKQHELMFEACKHFTTLNTAAALVVVAVFREMGVGVVWAAVPLVLFGVSLGWCAYGMIETALKGLDNIEAVSSITLSLVCGALLFFFGLGCAVVAALLG